MKDIRILVLQRGWVVVGEYTEAGEYMYIENGSVVHRWGTKYGIGQIAKNGPTANTELHPYGKSKHHVLTVVLPIECDASKWDGKLK